MAFKEFSTDYLVLEAENASLFDLFRIFYSSELDKRDFFDAPTGSVEALLASFRHRWVVFVSVVAQKLLLLGGAPMKWIGSTIELLLNYPISNGGYFNLLVNLVKGRVVRPDVLSSTFRSLMGNLDLRVDLDKNITKGDYRYNAALSIMASKLSYENEAFVETVVREKWQMEFLNFYNFYNDYLDTYSTQAIIFQDKKNNPELVMVAFRGTEPFNPDDWRADVDLSWYELPGLGRIHAGFMKALGLQKEKGWPKEIDQNNNQKPLYAYYAIREQLKQIIIENKNTKFIMSGHSLGGALAILFLSILVLQNEELLLERCEGVYTFGQPRVGDEEFGEFMKKNLRSFNIGYHRYVYANDIVPRLPYDDKTLYYKHFGPSIYFNVFYKGQILEEEPNKNYFSLMWVLPKYLNAIFELIRSSILPWILGDEYREGWFEILYRVIGLIIPGLSNHGPQDYDNVTRLASSISSLSIDEIMGQQGLKVE
ncbi:hypothetical protein Leryth_025089 [Lithospermum erythrorhizon]|nr:hypothetical protein Leryth_025089 [Lithospermum erythrorhizon]